MTKAIQPSEAPVAHLMANVVHTSVAHGVPDGICGTLYGKLSAPK